MATLNNNVFLTIPYIQNQLTYNVPLTTYTLEQIQDLLQNQNIKIQPFKQNKLGLPINVGIELVRNVDFVANLNNTSNGIIIILNQNIAEATHLKIRRDSIRVITTNYEATTQQFSLKPQLENDTKNIMNSLQDDNNRINDLNTNVSKYADAITQNYDNLTALSTEVASIPRNASQLPAEPNLGLTATNTQQQIYEVKTFVDQANKGITPKGQVRVASTSNIALTGVSVVDGITLTNGNRVILQNQTTKGQNGIYSYNNGNLTRTDDADTLSKIAGAQVQVLEGTFANKELRCIVNNVNGVLNTEPVSVEVVFNAVGDNQILPQNLAKQPANTIIANITNNTANPTYVNKQDFKTFLEINNINNTADLNKPISTATQTALNLKTNQTDFENLNAYVVQADNDLLTAIGQKENILPRGGEQDYLGFEGNEIAVKTFSKATIDLENVDNTSDLDKPISITQQEEFNKYLKERGILPINNLNLTFDLLTGIYFVDNINQKLNFPSEIQATSTITLILSKVYLGEQYQKQIQQIYETKNNNTICYYIRSGNVLNNTFTDWERMSTKKELDATNLRIDNLEIGEFGGEIYLIPQVDNLLNAKENTITAGTTSQYYRGDKQMAELITDAVPEGSNPDRFYFSQPRVRATILNGYQINSTASTTATDTILQALGKKADLNSPTFTGTPTAPTQATSDNSTKLATTANVKANINDLRTELREMPFRAGEVRNTNFTLTQNDFNRALYLVAGCNTITFPLHTQGGNPVLSGSLLLMQNSTGVNVALKYPDGNNVISNNAGGVLPNSWSAIFMTDGGNVWTLLALYPSNSQGEILTASPSVSDNSTKIATTQIVNAKLNEMMVGEVKAYARQNFNDFTTNGGTGTWLYCNGRTLSTATYPLLFQRIGYAYGGSGTSFNIPDLRERVVAGASSNEPINKKEGLKQEIILTKYLEPHDHGMFNNNLTELRYGIKNVSLGIYQTFGNETFTNFNTVSKTETIGGNEPYSKMQPTIYLPYFIYAI